MSFRILAVEDTPTLRALLELCLIRAGYTVQLAENGQAAIDLFVGGTYDAVIMDIQMPVMDGLTAVAHMRAQEQKQNSVPIPMLALTANTEASEQKQCIDAGFTAVIHKPFGRGELISAIAKELGAGRIAVTVDPEFAVLIAPFLENCRRDAETMTQDLERRDYEAISQTGHKLTGAGASFGFKPLSDEARLIEAAARNADADGVRAHIAAIQLYLNQVKVVYP